MDKLDKYITQYRNNEIKHFLTNPLFRIKVTHIVGVLILIISALFFTDNIIAIIVQLVVALVVAIHDVDDRFLKTNLATKIDQLYESQEYITAVIDTNAHAIIAVDSTGVISRFNKAAQTMFGYSQEEMSQVDDLLKIIPEEYRKRHDKGLKNFFKTGKVESIAGKTLEFQALKKDGTLFPMKITIGFKRIKNKILVVASIQDVTFEKEQEKILASSQRHAQMGEMIGNIAHQWRQPLSAISMLASGTKLNKTLGILDDNELDVNLDKIVDYSQYLSETIEDFRNFYKEDKELVQFSIVEQMDYSISLLSASYKNNGVDILKEYSKDDFIVFGLATEFSQVIVNILNNAKDILIEKNPKNKILLVKMYENKKYNICEIHDNGGGVPSNIKDKIFDPYFTTKHQSQGTGIGLHMSKEIIQSTFNGIIKLENKTFTFDNTDHFGACFIIKLPKV